MFKNSLSLQLAIFVAVVAAVSGGLSFVYSEALPYIHSEFPSIRRVHDERPYVINSVLSFASLLLSFFTFLRFSAFKRGVKGGFGAFDTLNEVISHAEFTSSTGLAFIDADGRILSGSPLLVRLSNVKSAVDLIGKRHTDVFSKRFCRLLDDLEENAKTTRMPAAVEVSDWTPFCEHQFGSIMIVASPAYQGDRFLGLVISLRSATELRLAEESAIMHQQNYQVLFDSLGIGVAVFRSAVAPDGGPDGYVTEANAAFKRLFEGLPLPYTEPASAVWPSFLEQDNLRDGINFILEGLPTFKCDLFSPLVGRHFAVELVRMPAGRVLALVSDQTEARTHEERALALNDKLQRNLAQQNEYVHEVLDDIAHFEQAANDIAESQLDRICQSVHKHADSYPDITEACSSLYRMLNQMSRYHGVLNLQYQDAALVQPGEVVSRLLEPISNRYPHISFEQKAVSAVVASQEVLTSILEQLILSVTNLPIVDGTPRIQIGGYGDFLRTGLYVAGWGFDFGGLILEIPEKDQPLDWLLTSDLELAVVRRMVAKHGGVLSVAPTSDLQGVQLSFTVGNPN